LHRNNKIESTVNTQPFSFSTPPSTVNSQQSTITDGATVRDIRDVSLINFGFSPEFSKPIEAKQIAEQEAKQAEFAVQKATQDAQAEINRALLSSRSSALAAANFNSRNFVEASD
jgi:regulator of protease activity HflC (stomatin/prohibitin superfamily)